MKSSRITPFNMIAVAGLALAVTACDSNDSASTGSLSVGVTDAPVDTAQKVIVEFSGVEIKPANGESISFDFTERCTADPAFCQIDLLTLTNGVSQQLLDDETVPAGQYNWMRLMVNAEPITKDSYIVINDKEFELSIPSGAQTGLKLNRGFVVPAGGAADFTIDFDLRKSVHDPVGTSDYLLRPTLRIVDNAEIGTLSGSVDPSFYDAAGGTCTGAVYVFEGDVTDPDDVDGGLVDPITTAIVPNDGVYNYTVGFLSEGDYRVAFTCDASADAPEVNDDNATVSFLSTAIVSITADGTTTYNFQPLP
ncbi:MAG: DUF4382 domain-containing protein [Gammaproteobacteria bacterium]|nr:DUF4382 domain-containing protein [Gammaproteobacteria bacterium]